MVKGPKERVVAAGSDLQLVCLYKEASAPPEFIFWYQDAKMINYDTKRGIHVASESPSY
ncbi:hypothetical protein SK128_018881, partial [Halocaridina rubra]